MKKRLSLFLLLILINIPCYATTSGVLQNITTDKVLEVLKKQAIKQNNTLTDITPSSITIISKTSFMEGVLYGSNFNMTPERRYYIAVVQDGKDVLIQLTAKMVTNPNSGFQTTTDLRGEELYGMQLLEKKFNPHYTYGFNYIPRRKYLDVTSIDENEILPVDNDNTLHVGNRIRAIEPITLLQMQRGYQVTKDSPDEITLTIQYNKKSEPREVKLKKRYIVPNFE